MKKMKIVAFALIAMAVVSCGKKYPDGGKIGKATSQIQTTWKLDAYLVNDVDVTTDLLVSNFTETYNEGDVEGEGTLDRSYNDKDGQLQTQNGNYKFDAEFTKVDIDGVGSVEMTDATGTSSTSSYTVLMLTDSEFRYTFENGGDKQEFRFVK